MTVNLQQSTVNSQQLTTAGRLSLLKKWASRRLGEQDRRGAIWSELLFQRRYA
ncbi:hypothetical protein ACEYW6_19510 [Nostoc sp. UIC 10607]